MIKFICYPKCTTCQRAKKWLDDNKIEYELRDIKLDNPTLEELTEWYNKSGLSIKKFFNTSGLLYKSLSKLSRGPVMAGLSFLPVVFLFLCMENDYYRFQGHIAFILMLTALYAYASIPKDRLRYLAGALTVPVLYHAAGSIALVFAVAAVIWDLAANGIKGFRSLICPAVFAMTAVVYVKASMVSSWEHSLTPFMYYDWPSTYFFPVYAWVMVPLLFLLAWILSSTRWWSFSIYM